MLSTNSLSAFSSATTGTTPGQPNLRLVREPVTPVQSAGQAERNAVPRSVPTFVPPRGSLLNLSV